MRHAQLRLLSVAWVAAALLFRCIHSQDETSTAGIAPQVTADAGLPAPAPTFAPPPPQSYTNGTQTTNAVDISCSIVSWGEYDYKFSFTPTGFTSRCIEAVRNARARCGGRMLNYVPTHFWDTLYDDNSVERYCFKTNHGTDWEPVVCERVTDQMIKDFEIGYKYCFLEAAKVGFQEIHILPHIDDGHQEGGWRNALLLDPFVKSDGYSYIDIMIAPMARGLRDVLAQYPNVKVGFALQGEKSYALLVYPDKWMQLYDGVKYFIANGSRAIMEQVHVGVSFNSNKMCGLMMCSELQVSDTQYILNPQRPNAQPIDNATVPMPHIDVGDIGRMFNKTDFLGISAYPPINNVADDLYIDSGPDSPFGIPLGNFNAELTANLGYGLSELKAWRPDLELHYSEFGFGGGGGSMQERAASGALSFGTPYNGISGLYHVDKNPWLTPDMARARYVFYTQTIRWLNQGTHGMWPITHLFLWNLYSWDPAAIYWACTNYADNSSYYAPGIMDCIRAWNHERRMCDWDLPVPGGGK